MAQKTGQEETEFKVVPDTLNLCVNKCGVTANSSTNNMCHKCFNTSPPLKFSPHKTLRSAAPAETSVMPDLTLKVDTVRRVVNRCSGCMRKVGLTGFRCRCGELFCSDHRYSDRHNCSYDYKAAGREVIARQNPLVRAAKIVKV